MANTIVEVQLPTGATAPTLSLYSLSSDISLANSGGADTLTQESNALGFWRATVTEALAAIYRVKVLDGSALLYSGYVYLQDDTSTYYPADNYVDAYQLSLGAGGDATAANQATIIADIAALNNLSAAQVNAEVDTALSDYDAPTKAELDSGLAALNDPSAAAVADAVWDEAASEHNNAGSFGKFLRQLKEGVVSVEADVNDVSATTTSFVTTLTEASDSHYSDLTCAFIGGNLTGQSRIISSYNGTTKTLTFDEAWSEAPADTDTFIILTTHIHTKTQIADAVLDKALSEHTTAGTLGKAVSDIETDTSTTIPGQIAGLNDLSAAQVNAEVDTALSDYDAPTKAELDSGLAALNDLSAAQVNAEVDTALSDYDGPTKTEMDSAFTEIKGATFSGSTDSLEAIRDRGDAAWVGSSGAVEATRSRAWAFTASNKTVYALVYNSDDEVYNGSTFETYNSANYATYAQAATEETGTGKYSLALPADAYAVEFRQQFGASASVSADDRIGSIQV